MSISNLRNISSLIVKNEGFVMVSRQCNHLLRTDAHTQSPLLHRFKRLILIPGYCNLDFIADPSVPFPIYLNVKNQNAKVKIVFSVWNSEHAFQKGMDSG